MILLKRKPSKELEKLIKHYWLLDISGNEKFNQRIVPFGSVDLIIHLKNPMCKWDNEDMRIIEPLIFMEGQYLHSKYVQSSAATLILGVSFHPWATKSFYNLFASEFSNQVIPYDLIDPQNIKTLYNSLDPFDSYDTLFNKIEDFFLTKKRMVLNSKEQEIQEFLLNGTELSWSKWSTLYKDWGDSMRSREQLFKRLIGINSKKLYSKLKFQNAIKLMEYAKHKKLTHIALDAGYFDQADFCRHFKNFAGITPKNYFKEGISCFGQLIA